MEELGSKSPLLNEAAENQQVTTEKKNLVPTQNLKTLYDNLSKREGFNVPYDRFELDMQNEDNLKTLHGNLSKEKNFTVPYDQFKKDMFSSPVEELQSQAEPKNGYNTYNDLINQRDQLQRQIEKVRSYVKQKTKPTFTSPEDVAKFEKERFGALSKGQYDVDEKQLELDKLQSEFNEVSNKIDRQAKLNKEQTGYVSEEHKTVSNIYKDYADQLNDALTQKNKRTQMIVPIGFPGQAVSIPDNEDAKKVNDIKDIQNILKKISKEYEKPQGKNVSSELNGLLYGLTKSKTAKDFFTLGINEMSENINVKQAYDKQKKGEELTPEESNLLNVYQNFKALQQSSPENMGSIVGTGLQDMIPFIVQFAATDGISSAAKKTVSDVIKNQIASKALGYTAGLTAQSLAMPYTYQEYARRRAPITDINGNLTDGQGQFEAAWKSVASTMAEVAGENITDVAQSGLRNNGS